MNIAIPEVVSQLRTPYANIDNTCASGNQCEADVNLNTALSYPQLIKKPFALDFTPPTYGVGTGVATRPIRDTLSVSEGFTNPFGMGPIDDITDRALAESQNLALARINSAPGSTQDDPTQRLIDPPATMSNTKEVLESFSYGPISVSNSALVILIALGLGGMVLYANRKQN